MSQIGKAIRKFRLESNMSQMDIAKRLGISQAHVSRLEKGNFEVPPHLFVKIQRLLRLPIESHKFSLAIASESNWRISYFSYPEKSSGDKVRVNTKASQDKVWLLHCDAVGSDNFAIKDANYLEVSFDTVINSIPHIGLSPEAVYMAVNKTIRSSVELWRGEPSGNIVSLTKGSDRLDFINAGMPTPLCYDGKKTSVIKVQSGNKPIPPIGQAANKESFTSKSICMKKEDVMFFFSDGFEELYKQISRVPLEILIETFCKIQKGDVEGIGSKILKTIEEQLAHKRIEDDFSFALVSLI
ncbi:SpoIIE family protein phosphatase [Pseudobdellovibrio exovorus]|uniref:HTH cro/C1-type domain-containing protein n=1 Tax=Pseudobdellovibrio exovorus JSS TaxID=1184267 RepID=M4VB64_9BACT|nr:SpoIIE family protein phosphatase [Pseudobdellovibrio exovorus]AGH96627.1 hypothetical protein A11Q_2411 [Pseudobdellovibrio exovorus JSS]